MPWVAACQHLLCLTISQHFLKFMFIELVMPSSQILWCRPIGSSVAGFSSCLQSFPALGSFPMSRLFTTCGQSIGASASSSVLPMNVQGWFPLGLTSLIPLLPRGLSGVFSAPQFDSISSLAFILLWSKSYICAWLLEKLYFDYTDLCLQSDISAF